MADSVIGAWKEMDKDAVLAVLDPLYPNRAALGRLLGIAERTPQRWFAPKEAKQHRSPSPKLLEKLKALLPAILMRITGLFMWDSPKDSRRTPDMRARDIEFVIPADDIPDLADAVKQRDEDKARTIVFESYGMNKPGDVPNGQFSMEPTEGE